MTTQTKDAIIVAVIMIGGLAFLIGDLHRTILRWAWPYVEAFWTYITL